MPPSLDVAGIQRLAARLGDDPIGVFTADWTLVWWNGMWSAPQGDPSELPAADRNLARALFGDGAGRAAMRPVRSEARRGRLRPPLGHGDGGPAPTERKKIRHPEIGDIVLDCDVHIVPGGRTATALP
jgi:MmyB-like transcription regulator ligand binding domain